jgi:HEAT repeat protein
MTNDPDTADAMLRDMELAKALIGRYPDVDVDALMSAATDQSKPTSARVAAIYALGFVDDDRRSVDTLARIMATDADPLCRDHAAEALGHLDVPPP